MPHKNIDANDVDVVIKEFGEAAERARRGEGPTYFSANTYRFRGHSMSDAMAYRTKEELESAKERDPIVAYEMILKERGWLDDETLERYHDEVKAEIEEAIAFAEASDPTPPEALYQDVTVAHHIPQE